MLTANLLKWILVFLLFIALPIALMRFMVHRTIEVRHKDKHR